MKMRHTKRKGFRFALALRPERRSGILPLRPFTAIMPILSMPCTIYGSILPNPIIPRKSAADTSRDDRADYFQSAAMGTAFKPSPNESVWFPA